MNMYADVTHNDKYRDCRLEVQERHLAFRLVWTQIRVPLTTQAHYDHRKDQQVDHHHHGDRNNERVQQGLSWQPATEI